MPDGWVLRESIAEEVIVSLEEFVETERAKLVGDHLTPLTKDLFYAWKEKWLERMNKEKDDEIKKKMALMHPQAV